MGDNSQCLGDIHVLFAVLLLRIDLPPLRDSVYS